MGQAWERLAILLSPQRRRLIRAARTAALMQDRSQPLPAIDSDRFPQPLPVANYVWPEEPKYQPGNFGTVEAIETSSDQP